MDLTVAAGTGVAVGVAVMAVVYLRRRLVRQRTTDPAKLALVDHVVVYGSTGCAGCRGVWAQREQLAALAACPVDFRLASEKEAMVHAGGAIPPPSVTTGTGTRCSVRWSGSRPFGRCSSARSARRCLGEPVRTRRPVAR